MTSKYQLLPPLSDSEYADLRASIEQNGVLVAIEMDEAGNTLDGHHRLKICEELQIREYPVTIRYGLSEIEKRAHVRRVNLVRRHLSRAQRRALIAEQLHETPERSDRQIAEGLNVHHSTVGAVRDNLVLTGEIRQLDRTVGKDGRARRKPCVVATSKRDADKVLALLAHGGAESLPEKPIPVKRAERIAREHQAHQRASAVLTNPPTAPVGGADLRLGDFRTVLADVPDGSIPLIFTDPIYLKEYLPLWSDLAIFASRVLRPGGILACYAGQFFLPEVFSRLGERLTYIWTGCIKGSGLKSQIYHVKVHSAWKPILIYSKPPYSPSEWFVDYYDGQGPEKAFHDFQQAESEAQHFIELFTERGETVIDPFCGSGTTAVAALRSGRAFTGADIDPAALGAALQRVRDFVTTPAL